jgi:tetratricopeptide (TPR) repeat protein
MMHRLLERLGIREWLDRRKTIKELRRFDQQALRADRHNLDPLKEVNAQLKAGNRTEALRLWEQALARHPILTRKWKDSANPLLALGRFDEAEAFMVTCQKLHPKDVRFAEGHALISERRGDLSEAVNRWRRTRKRFPGAWQAYVHEAECLCSLNRIDKADRLICRARKLFPNQVEVQAEWGLMAERKDDWLLAAKRWEWVRDHYPQVDGTLGVARALEHLGKPDAALQVLLAVEHKFALDDRFKAILNKVRKSHDAH